MKPSLIAPGKPCEFCYVSHTPTECPTLRRGKVARIAAQVKMPTALAYVPSAVVAWNNKAEFDVKGTGVEIFRDVPAIMKAGDCDPVNWRAADLGKPIDWSKVKPSARKRVREGWQLGLHAPRIEPHAATTVSCTSSVWFEPEKLSFVDVSVNSGDAVVRGVTRVVDVRIVGVLVDRDRWVATDPSIEKAVRFRGLVVPRDGEISFLVHNESDEPIAWHGGLFGKASDEDPRTRGAYLSDDRIAALAKAVR